MNITVYTSSSCPWCDKVKKYLKTRGVRYKEVNVSQDMKGALEMMRKSGQRGVPVIDVDGRIIVGFDKKELDRLL